MNFQQIFHSIFKNSLINVKLIEFPNEFLNSEDKIEYNKKNNIIKKMYNLIFPSIQIEYDSNKININKEILNKIFSDFGEIKYFYVFTNKILIFYKYYFSSILAFDTLNENLNEKSNNNNNNLENIYHYKIEDESQYKMEEEEEDEENKLQTEQEPPTYIVCFSSQDIAFDFNRYMNMLKIINPTFKEIKSNIIMPKKVIKKTRNNQNATRSYIKYGVDYGLEEGTDLMKRNNKILNLVRLNFLKKAELKKLRKSNSQESITGLGPYLSFTEIERIQKKEDKKKWINPEGFISCVGKYSGIKI